MNKKAVAGLALAAALAATAALAAPPGPKYWGDIYVYFDDHGQQVGYASIDCHGVLHRSGQTTSRYSYGQATCG